MHEAICKKCKVVVASGPDEAAVKDALQRHEKQKHSLFKRGKK